MDIDFPFCLQGLAPSQLQPAIPGGLWEAANCPIVQNSSRRQCARCPLPNGPTTAVTDCPSQQPQPGQTREQNLRAFPRTVVYVPNTTPLLIMGSGSKQTGLSPHFTDEEIKAQRGGLTLSRSHTSPCQERVWNPGLKIQCSFQLHRSPRSGTGRQRWESNHSKWVKRKDIMARRIAESCTHSKVCKMSLSGSH